MTKKEKDDLGWMKVGPCCKNCKGSQSKSSKNASYICNISISKFTTKPSSWCENHDWKED